MVAATRLAVNILAVNILAVDILVADNLVISILVVDNLAVGMHLLGMGFHTEAMVVGKLEEEALRTLLVGRSLECRLCLDYDNHGDHLLVGHSSAREHA
jgi:hypothetical protein